MSECSEEEAFVADKSGYSEEIEGLFGKYSQHYDENGNKLGYSEERSGLLGDYTQHYEQDGSKLGYSEERSGLLPSTTRPVRVGEEGITLVISLDG
jgi:hypothetical protein